MNFRSAQSAVIWADEISTRPQCDSFLGKMLTKSGSGGLTPMELRDVALTITNFVYNLEKPVGILFLLVYGNPEREGALAVMDAVAHQIHRLPEGEKKDIARLRLLVGAVMENIRQKELYDRRFSRVKMAKFISISRKSFSERGWPELEAEVRKILGRWLLISEERLHAQLREWEWMK